MPISSPGLPVTLVLSGRPCLVVGGGPVAARKAGTLLAAGATVTMVAPHFAAAGAGLSVTRERRRYRSGEVAGYHLVVAATGIAQVDAQVSDEAIAAGVLVNAADDPEHCTFILPAVHRVGHVSVAVSTDGYSPALASLLRDRLAPAVGEEVGVLAERLGEARQALHGAGLSSEGRDWRGLIDELQASTEPAEVIASWVNRQVGEPDSAVGSKGSGVT